MERFEKVKQSPTVSKLRCCRACLETEGKLYNIHDHNFAEVFTSITGVAVKVDKFPQHICQWCASLLRKCVSFKGKCRRARWLLISELVKRDLTTKFVRTVGRAANHLVGLSAGPIQFNCIQEPAKMLIIQPMDIDNRDTAGLSFNFSVENVEYLEEDFELNDDINKNNDEITVVENIEDNELTVNDDDDDLDAPFSDDLENVDTTGKEQTELPILKRKLPRLHNYLSKMSESEFENKFKLKIIHLNKEEMLEEIETRKASEHYRKAPFKCNSCGKPFLTQVTYNNHLARHAPNRGLYACSICQIRYKSKGERRLHEMRHRIKYVCECGYVSRSRDEAKKHYEEKSRTFQCEHCGKSFRKNVTYSNHLREAHSALNVACGLCGDTFVGENGLRLHMGRVHHTMNQLKKLKCETCSTAFVTPSALQRHKTHDHTGCACAQCGDSFTSEESLQHHMTEKHPWCKECSQRFLDATAYQRHVRRKHLGRRASPARPPGSAPRRRRVPPRGSHGSSLVCDVCGRVFDNKANLLCHLHNHGQDYTCLYCPKRFPNQIRREQHMRIHTGEKPYQCDHCGAAFNLKCNMQRHIMGVHMGIHKSAPCHICGRFLSTAYNLRLHVRTVHFGEPWPKRIRKPRN